MWKFKSDFKNSRIVLKRHGVVVDARLLSSNQELGNLIMSDQTYNSAYGHCLEWDGANPMPLKKINPDAKFTIEVFKKKEPTVSTQVEKDGKTLETPQESKLSASKPSPVTRETKDLHAKNSVAYVPTETSSQKRVGL